MNPPSLVGSGTVSRHHQVLCNCQTTLFSKACEAWNLLRNLLWNLLRNLPWNLLAQLALRSAPKSLHVAEDPLGFAVGKRWDLISEGRHH